MSEHSPTATRRGLLTVGLGVLGVSVAACDLQDLDPRSPLPAPGTGATTTASPDPDSDETLVSEVVSLITDRRARVDAVRRRHGDLRQELGPLARMHVAHLRVLDPDGSTDETDLPVLSTARSAKDRRRVIQAERTLQQQVARAAERADAGQVAKVLASVSASIAQHLVALAEAS